ncbi:MBL fold metallo-hydrolase [Alicyclobacillus tolerans]|uniref:MBL fold metallo-hydrolase n=1 Tax=Alicyclobacillus tolerans TaxID=90970 RepID=UPI001F2753CF|nr:MBL fold metallo-hydrolase [Alicyclobacillus tolerans]MCF8564094.1 MBL fold metallo-hydrolase [Alicyclobacillus tolerans]
MEIVRGVYLLESTKGSYSYLVMGEEPVLIDTGMPGRHDKIANELLKLGMTFEDIAHILLTHHDVDHIGNAKYIQSHSHAKVWAAKEDAPVILGEQNRHGLKRVIAALVRADTPKVDAVYQPGEKIGSLEVIETPGHTPGHVSVLYQGTLFAGDLVTSRKGKLRPSPGFLTWDNKQLRQSIAKVGSFSFDWVCPAHGEPVQRGSLWELL